MPLFKRSPNDITSKHDTRANSASPERKGIFSSNHRTNDNATNNPNIRASSSSPDRKRSFFSGNRRSSTSSSESETLNRSDGHRSGTGIFARRLRNKSRSIDRDPSIIGARQKVSDAEQAEKDADRALMEARNHVQLARDHVRTLEQEAIEDARMAKLKQAEAKVIQKSAKSLGRHGP